MDTDRPDIDSYTELIPPYIVLTHEFDNDRNSESNIDSDSNSDSDSDRNYEPEDDDDAFWGEKKLPVSTSI